MLSSDRWLTVKPGLPCVSCKVHMCLAASWGLWRQKPGGSEYSHALVPFPCMHEPAPLQANLVEAGSVLAHESRRRLFQVLPFTGAQTRRARRACWQAPCSTPGNARHTDTCDSTPPRPVSPPSAGVQPPWRARARLVPLRAPGHLADGRHRLLPPRTAHQAFKPTKPTLNPAVSLPARLVAARPARGRRPGGAPSR